MTARWSALLRGGEWRKEYGKGIETKPDSGYLFAYSKNNLSQAMAEMGGEPFYEFWLAEAKVIGEIAKWDIGVEDELWETFWKNLKPRRRAKGVKYLLCSSITLIERILRST